MIPPGAFPVHPGVPGGPPLGVVGHSGAPLPFPPVIPPPVGHGLPPPMATGGQPVGASPPAAAASSMPPPSFVPASASTSTPAPPATTPATQAHPAIATKPPLPHPELRQDNPELKKGQILKYTDANYSQVKPMQTSEAVFSYC